MKLQTKRLPQSMLLLVLPLLLLLLLPAGALAATVSYSVGPSGADYTQAQAALDAAAAGDDVILTLTDNAEVGATNLVVPKKLHSVYIKSAGDSAVFSLQCGTAGYMIVANGVPLTLENVSINGNNGTGYVFGGGYDTVDSTDLTIICNRGTMELYSVFGGGYLVAKADPANPGQLLADTAVSGKVKLDLQISDPGAFSAAYIYGGCYGYGIIGGDTDVTIKNSVTGDDDLTLFYRCQIGAVYQGTQHLPQGKKVTGSLSHGGSLSMEGVLISGNYCFLGGYDAPVVGDISAEIKNCSLPCLVTGGQVQAVDVSSSGDIDLSVSDSGITMLFNGGVVNKDRKSVVSGDISVNADTSVFEYFFGGGYPPTGAKQLLIDGKVTLEAEGCFFGAVCGGSYVFDSFPVVASDGVDITLSNNEGSIETALGDFSSSSSAPVTLTVKGPALSFGMLRSFDKISMENTISVTQDYSYRGVTGGTKLQYLDSATHHWQPGEVLLQSLNTLIPGYDGSINQAAWAAADDLPELGYIAATVENLNSRWYLSGFTVSYDWGDTPGVDCPHTAAALPVDTHIYRTEALARAAVDTGFTAATQVNDTVDGAAVTWSFSGWTAGDTVSGQLPLVGAIPFTGSWTKPDAPPEQESYTATLVKLDGTDLQTTLAGAKFALYRKNKDGSETLLGSYTTDSSGRISVNQLDPGSYYWIELAAPAGYRLDASPHSFTINNSDSVINALNQRTPVPGQLNSSDHYAYIIGYADGGAHPQAHITRAEVATIFFRLLTDETREQNLSRENSFSDVMAGQWCNTAISTMARLHIINGYTDGSFKPNAGITRAEFAAIAARFDSEGDSSSASFTDISGHWAEKEICIAANNGWVSGYADGSFRPDRSITRAEAVTLINRVLQRLPENRSDLLDEMVSWNDNLDTAAWYYLAVQEASNSHYYERKANGYEKWTELRAVRDWAALEK